MAIEKILNTRLQLRYDTHEKWIENDPVLYAGEVALSVVNTKQEGQVNFVPSVLIKVGDNTHKYSELDFTYAKAADVVAAAKTEAGLTAFINNVIANAGIASDAAMQELSGRVSVNEDDIETLKGDVNTAGSVAKAIKDYVDALNLATTYVHQEINKSLVSDSEIAKLAGMSPGANKVEASTIDGNIKIDGVETVVYAHSAKHVIDDVTGLQTALDAKVAQATYNEDKATFATKTELGEVRGIAEAARTETEVNGQIDAKIAALNLATTYEPIGAETRAKAYADGLITAAKLDQYTTEQEVKDIIDGVIASAADSDTYNSLTKLIDYIDRHGGEASNMAQAIDSLEEKVEVIEGKPAYGITAAQISNWDKEVGAKALAESKTTTAEVKAQIEAYKYATIAYADGKAADAQAAAEDTAASELASARTAITAEIGAAISKEITRADGKYELKGAESRAIAAAKLETESQVKALLDGQVTTNKNNIASVKATADTAIQNVTSVEGNGIKATKTGTTVSLDWDPQVVFVFNCGTSANL